MNATTPDQVIQLFSQRLNEGDLEGALALYDRGASFSPQPGAQVTGAKEIRGALEGFFALDPTIEGEIQGVLEAGDLASSTTGGDCVAGNTTASRWRWRERAPTSFGASPAAPGGS